MKEKLVESPSVETKKDFRNQTLQQKFHQKEKKNQDSPASKIHRTIRKINSRGSQKNISKYKKIGDYAQGMSWQEKAKIKRETEAKKKKRRKDQLC